MIDPAFWKGRRVLVTGHTGFKGSWASLWLSRLGAEVTGFALPPPTEPSLFVQARVGELVRHVEGDVRDIDRVVAAFKNAKPEIVLHLAAQALVHESYADPVGTYATNVLGTVNVLEAVRRVGGVRAAVVVTSDKCYENREWDWAYRESDAMGGHDPYSSSKGCQELVVAAYARSFLPELGLATARAGNVIGGGDWAKDRLVPDAIRAFSRKEKVVLRHPDATRPWQHVLDPLSAYLLLAERAAAEPAAHRGAWNIGPDPGDAWPVARVVEALARRWGPGAGWVQGAGEHPHEAHTLALDASKARRRLGWHARVGMERALEWTAQWYRDVAGGADARTATLAQIGQFEALP